MMRLAMMRVVEGGRSVPDATSVGGESGDEDDLSRVMGSLPNVRGPKIVPTDVTPSRRYRSNLCTLLVPLDPP